MPASSSAIFLAAFVLASAAASAKPAGIFGVWSTQKNNGRPATSRRIPR